MRSDSIGLFWTDIARKKGVLNRVRPLAPIPETGWRPPKDLPNLSAATTLGIDIETFDPEIEDHGPGWSRGKPEIFNVAGISVSTQDRYKWYFPVRHTVEPEFNLNPEHVFRWAKEQLGNPNQTKVGANLIYDIGGLREEGIIVRGPVFDMSMAEALLDERAMVRLDKLGEKYLGHGKLQNNLFRWSADSYGGNPTHEVQAGNIYRSPPRLVGPYAEEDSLMPFDLLPIMWAKLEAESLTDLFRIECSLINLVVDMRFRGVAVDTAKAEQLRNSLLVRIGTAQKSLDSIAGFQVNVGAGASLAKLFDKLGIWYPRTEPTKKAPNGNPSFKKDWLKTVQHPVANLVNDIRRLKKLVGTFLESYILGGHTNGILHGSFHPLRNDRNGTIIGRFSSSNPNLQNLPIRDKEILEDGRVERLGKEIRAIFKPFDGHKQWRKFDLSQIQYRGMVHCAQGPGADDARSRYINDPLTDFHKWATEVVQQVFSKAVERIYIKELNFGTLFGMGKKKLLLRLGGLAKEADAFFKAYHQGVPFVKPTISAISEYAKLAGFVVSPLGRRARFDLWEPDRKWGERDNEDETPALPLEQAIRVYGAIRRAYLHKALNRYLQMLEADCMKMAMSTCYTTGVWDQSTLPVLQVHDELDHSDDGEHDEVYLEEKRIMETAVKLRVPILCEMKTGSDWGVCG